jgi:hypothetical protein
MASCCLAGKRRARFRRNLASSNGIPSVRRRRWPMGYSITTSGRIVPSVNSTVSPLAIDRLSRAAILSKAVRLRRLDHLA